MKSVGKLKLNNYTIRNNKHKIPGHNATKILGNHKKASYRGCVKITRVSVSIYLRRQLNGAVSVSVVTAICLDLAARKITLWPEDALGNTVTILPSVFRGI